MENEHNKVKGSSKRSPEELYNKFIEAEDCPEIIQSFQRLVHALGVKADTTPREFYQDLKSKLQSWKCKSLWELLDNRANQKEYSKGTICEDIHALVIGCGPIGLRTAIELALLGGQVIIVEKRQTFSRNNVLHLWPFLLTDFRSLGAKKFYGKFCSGSIEHISIRRLQSILLKTALIFGVKVFTGVTFENVIEPISEEEGWKCSVTPSDHFVSDFELDVLIGADGKKNVLPGFAQIEMRGTLAIGVTANFVNYYSEEEARVEEISGIAYQFNPTFFQTLKQLKRISLENIVYYKDETHYFVMTAVKSSLLERGVLKEDWGNNPQKLLSPDNIDKDNLKSYVDDAVAYATKGKLKHRDLKKDKKGNPDIAVFDFTSIKKAENSARIKERKGHKLLIGLVGDSLLEPFWPTGSGCARGVLSALDAGWMVRSFALDKPPLQILSERENIYRLLSGTSNQNLQKNFDLYTINPSSRYMHIPQKKIQEVYHLFDTDDPVNADFSLSSPTGILATKGTKKKRVSVGKKQRRRNKHIKFAVQSSQDFSPSSSGTEDQSPMSTEDRVRFAGPKPRPRSVSENLTSGGEEVHEIVKEGKEKGKKSRKSRSPLSSSQENQSKMKKSPFDTGLKKKSKKRKSDPLSGAAHEEKSTKRRSFFGFGRGKNKSRLGRKSPKMPDIPKEKKAVNEKITAEKSSKVKSSNGGFTPLGEPAWTKEETNSNFSRNQPTRRSAREIIAEMEARSRKTENGGLKEKKNAEEVPRRKPVNLSAARRPASAHEQSPKKTSVKRTTSELDITSPRSKLPKKEDLWDELSSLSPRAKEAVPVLTKMSPEKRQENHGHESHDIASAMRMAGLAVIATPLLVDESTQKSVLYSERSWFSRNNGHVKSAINKYDSLTGRTFLGKKKDGTPLRAPIDMVDSPKNQKESKPTLVEMSKKLAADEQQADKSSSMDVDDGLSSWQPTAIAFVEGKTGVREMEIAANEREMDDARQEKKFRRLKEDLSSLDQESTDSPVKKDFSSPIYKKTFIASVKETPKSKDKAGNTEQEHKQLETPRDYAKEAEWRKSPALAKKEMERLMTCLTETLSKERAEASIRFLISMFRRIQRNPREDKFRRIFKSRVKFKKYVWTVRNAKMFMFASGWIEVGSFLIFSAEKNVREPLAILNKHLGLLASGTSVQISTIKSTPKRDMDPRTPRSARALPFSIEAVPKTPRTPKTPKTSSSSSNRKTDSTRSVSRSDNRNKEAETPAKAGVVRTSSSKNTPLDKRFSKSVPLDLDSEWDLEMEDPLLDESLSKSAVKSSRVFSSAFDVRDDKDSRGGTPMGLTPKSKPVTPDAAIMEEIEGLSNTLDDLLESMEEEPSEDYKSNPQNKDNAAPLHEIKDLCTTLDYMLDSSEEDELDHDLHHWKKEFISSEVASPDSSASAFSKVPLRSSASEKISTTKQDSSIKDDISASPGSVTSPVKATEQKTKKLALETRDRNDKMTSESDTVSMPASSPVASDLRLSVQKKKKISLENKDKKSDITSSKSNTVANDTSTASVETTRQYSLRPRERNDNTILPANGRKKISRRKLPSEPDKRSRSVSDVQIQKRLSSASLKSVDPQKKERPSSRNSENSDKDTQESKPNTRRKVSNDSDISKLSKDRPFRISKSKSKSTACINDSTDTTKPKRSANSVSKNNKLSSSSMSKSEMNLTSGKVSTSSATQEKQKPTSLNRKQASPTNHEDTKKRRNLSRNTKLQSKDSKKVELLKTQSLSSVNEFKKPDAPIARKRPETSKIAGKPRESIGDKNLPTSKLDTSLKNRPPTGLERTRSARARRRQEIASKLESLETSYESLEKSPNRTLSKKSSTSSTESHASSLNKKPSLTETINEQQGSSLRKKTSVSRTSSAASRSSVTSGEDPHDISKRRHSTLSNDSSIKTRRRSSAKRTPSNASLERKKMDGLLSKEEQELLRKRSKSTSEKPGARATKDNLERIRMLRSKTVDISQIRRADSSGSESLRRSGSFKAKHRRAATRSSSKSQDDTKVIPSNLEQNSKITEDAKEPTGNVEQNSVLKSADDSFDDITIVERATLESVADGAAAGCMESLTKNEINDNPTFGLRPRQEADDEIVGVDTTDFVSSNSHDQELVSKTNTTVNYEQNYDEIPKEIYSESRNFDEESDCSSVKDDLKMEFRLQNTESWMVLDYERIGQSPKMLKKTTISTEHHPELDQSPRASISSIETLKENEDFNLKMDESVSENENETKMNYEKENGTVNFANEERSVGLVSNGALLSEKDNGFVHSEYSANTDLHTQNGSAKPYSNGKAPNETNGEIQHDDPKRKEDAKNKIKDSNEKPKSRRMKSQSVENLSSGKSRVTFGEIQNLNAPRASTLNKSPKNTKKHFPFGLRKKKTSGSCSDLDRCTPDIKVQSPSPTKTGVKTAPHGLTESTGDKSFSSPHDKSYEKKKLAPFKMFKKRKSQDASS